MSPLSQSPVTGYNLYVCRFVVEIPSAVGFILISIFLRVAEGVGSAVYSTSAQALVLKLFPNHITVIVVLLK